VPTGYAGAVSRDLFGEELYRLTREAGLDLRYTQQVDKSPFLAMVWSKDPPRYFFVGDDSADLAFDIGALPAGWLEEAECVHFGCISLVRQPLAGRLVALAERVHAAGRRVSFDPNVRNLMGPGYLATARRMAAVASFIKVSDEDLSALFPALDREAAVRELRAMAPRAEILLTLGAQGMVLLQGGRERRQPAFPVAVADTVGAGDATMGGWMASKLLEPEAPPEVHLAYAAATAALVCGRCGAYAPTRQEVAAVLAAGRA
jgi:fructokinase